MKIPPDRKAADKVIDQDGEFDASLDDDEPTTDELVGNVAQIPSTSYGRQNASRK